MDEEGGIGFSGWDQIRGSREEGRRALLVSGLGLGMSGRGARLGQGVQYLG